MVQILFPRSLVRSLPFFDIGLELLKLLYRYHCLPGRQTGQAAISGCYRQDCTLCRFAQVLYLSSELTRMACEYPTCRILLVEDFLQLQDGGCWIPFAALFLFSQYTRDGAGRRLFTSGSANRNHWGCCWCLSRSKWYVQFPLQKFSILIHTFQSLFTPNSLLTDIFEIGGLYVMSTRPPACVLFGCDTSRFTGFNGLGYSITLMFPFESSIFWKGCSIWRRQVSMCPACFLARYRVQRIIAGICRPGHDACATPG